MRKKLTPARVVSPGQILMRELEARGWTQKDLAEIINCPPQTINEIIKGTKQITPETAIELSAALETSEQFWNNLEANYRFHLAKKQKDESETKRRDRLDNIAPVSELIKRGWISASNSIDELEQSICEFFEIECLEKSPRLTANFRHSQQQEPETNAQIAWLQRVKYLARQQTIASFNRDNLKAIIPDVLSYAEYPEQIQKIPSFLLEAGVRFVIVPHLSRTYLDGAAFYLDENPVIALTLRHNRIDAFWFTLMHELAHIVAGHKGVYLDNLEKLEDNDCEKEANQIAQDWLVAPKELEGFIKNTQPNFSQKAIENFAKSCKRHPGIILGRLQYQEVVPYKNLRKLLIPVKEFLTDWIDK